MINDYSKEELLEIIEEIYDDFWDSISLITVAKNSLEWKEYTDEVTTLNAALSIQHGIAEKLSLNGRS